MGFLCIHKCPWFTVFHAPLRCQYIIIHVHTVYVASSVGTDSSIFLSPLYFCCGNIVYVLIVIVPGILVTDARACHSSSLTIA